jgi:hypothetical protein
MPPNVIAPSGAGPRVKAREVPHVVEAHLAKEPSARREGQYELVRPSAERAGSCRQGCQPSAERGSAAREPKAVDGVRLRTLSEAECYARCYGGLRGERVSVVKVLREEDRREREPPRRTKIARAEKAA